MRSVGDDELRELYAASRTIAVVGCSANWPKPPHVVPAYMQSEGFRILPVNPNEEELLGEPCVGSLEEIVEPVDIVDVFRAPEALPGIAKEAVAIGASALWCQFGVINTDAARIATDGGVTVIMDRCLKVEHARYVGRMHWLGFNTARITAVRGGLQ